LLTCDEGDDLPPNIGLQPSAAGEIMNRRG
jgi:hypothetical protein